jgi:hypothetical protein
LTLNRWVNSCDKIRLPPSIHESGCTANPSRSWGRTRQELHPTPSDRLPNTFHAVDRLFVRAIGSQNSGSAGLIAVVQSTIGVAHDAAQTLARMPKTLRRGRGRGCRAGLEGLTANTGGGGQQTQSRVGVPLGTTQRPQVD